MEKLTNKEWRCLCGYVEDLLTVLKTDGDVEIYDQYNKYTFQELILLHQKLIQKIY